MEVILALAIFGIIGTTIATLIVGSLSALNQGGEQTVAEALAEEGIEGVRSIRDNAWNELRVSASGIEPQFGKWTFKGEATTDAIGKYTRTITLDDVCRDATDEITSCPGIYTDLHSKKATVEIVWEVRPGINNTVQRIAYFTNWDSVTVTDTTKADFDAGSHNSTFNTTSGNDVELTESNIFLTSAIHDTIQLSGNENANSIFIDEYSDILYVGRVSGSNAEFLAFDISDIENGTPLESEALGSTEIGATVNSIFVDGNYAYLATDKSGEELIVIDLEDYTIIGSWDTPSNEGAGLSVVATGTRAFIGTQANGSGVEWYAVDVTDPTNINPMPLGDEEISGDVNDMIISGNFAHLATSHDTLDYYIIDLTDYNNEETIDVPGNDNAWSVYVDGTKSYIGKSSSTNAEIFEYDISTITSVNLIDAVEVGDNVLGIAVEDGFAYLATNDGSNELQIARLENYTVIGTGNANGSGTCNRVVFYGAYAYLACRDNTDEIQIFKSSAVAGWETPYEIGNGDTPGNDNAPVVGFYGDYVFIGTEKNSGGQEFFSFHVTSGANGLYEFEPSGSYEISQTVNDIFITSDGNYVYLATSEDPQELLVLNITDPANIVYAGVFDASDPPNGNGVYVVGNTAYLVTKNNAGTSDPFSCVNTELYVLDISNLSNIQCTKSGELGEDGNAIVVSGNYAYISTNGEEIQIWNIASNPLPTKVGGYDAPGGSNGRGLALDGNTLYFTRANGEFYVLDISGANATDPQPKDSIDLGNGNFNISIQSGVNAFVGSADGNTELKIVNIEDPNNISIRATFDADGNVLDAAYDAATGYVYLATTNNDQELQIVEALPQRFAQKGTFTSQIFDATDTSPFQVLSWTETIPSCTPTCDITILFRSAATIAGIKNAKWAGPEGLDLDEDDFFTNPTGTLIHPDTNGFRYFQYKAMFTGGGTESPELEDVIVDYK
ncbi:MAG: hypothetical protein COU08_03735 [Candidatus Harrisonbacteria bacterium CG10_big_fil_rev_8_21_14_0_10_42_17]|uniref:LVIVD repeat protein n=1 Tax=Candidatus Harrisonbacteria bacterium CG10_big_fil_rev_8_21_14_0_10_42_17 TaxID=1974584 RepID=A0A2M6WHA3_9BACT|nr:MAG: hypothetical protein COU08_03735 [Candidatus Harrisonbacteria bacterium CG10_big_fil_rev_8_21_14_0_10_42_17]